MNLERAVAILNENRHWDCDEWYLIPRVTPPKIEGLARLAWGRADTYVQLTSFDVLALARGYIRRDRIRNRAGSRRKKALRTAHENP